MPDFFTKNGVCLISLNYPVYGRPVKGLIEQQMKAVSAATSWLDANLETINPACRMDGAAMMGHSAGAYLAALTATSPRYRETAATYQKFILNDSNWYTGKVARYRDSIATISGAQASTESGRKALLSEWVPSELVSSACPTGKSPSDVLIMYSKTRPDNQQSEIRSFANTLNKCSAFNASLSAHSYDHKAIHRSIGQPGSSTGAAILEFLRKP